MTAQSPVQAFDKKSGLAFIVAFGVVSLFADAAYEGMRGITGPYLAVLGASGALVGAIAGTGELFGYLLRLVSGRVAEKTRAYWTFAILGYAVQMAAVPLMAFAGVWWAAAVLIVLERTGKAIRNPSANFLLSRAGTHVGQGWAFGLHEAMDQLGALSGPLITALVLARHGNYQTAFLWLGVPATLTLLSVTAVALRFPFAGHVQDAAKGQDSDGLSREFWLYAASAGLLAFGFADWPLIAFHFAQAKIVSPAVVPVLYAVAMAASGAGALAVGKAFDKRGFAVLLPTILIAAAASPLLFFGGENTAIAGAVLWGIALGVETSVFNAGVAHLVAEHVRARAYGIFSAVFGVSWFAGSIVLGALYDISFVWLVAVSIAAELLAIVPFVMATRLKKI